MSPVNDVFGVLQYYTGDHVIRILGQGSVYHRKASKFLVQPAHWHMSVIALQCFEAAAYT